MDRGLLVALWLIGLLPVFGLGFWYGTRSAAGPGDLAPTPVVRFAGAGASARALDVRLDGKVLSVGGESLTVLVSESRAFAPPNATPAPPASRIVLISPTARLTGPADRPMALGDYRPGDAVTIYGQLDQTSGIVVAQRVVAEQILGEAAPRP